MYLTQKFTGVVEGFEVNFVIYDKDHDTHGFVGYLPSDGSIYVAFRGSESLKNWMTNMESNKMDYKEEGCDKCQVHSGFMKAEKNVIEDILLKVAALSQQHGTKKVKTTGHSLGAALAKLVAIDLVKARYEVSMYNFG